MAALSRLLLATGLPIAVLAAAGAMAQGGPRYEINVLDSDMKTILQ